MALCQYFPWIIYFNSVFSCQQEILSTKENVFSLQIFNPFKIKRGNRFKPIILPEAVNGKSMEKRKNPKYNKSIIKEQTLYVVEKQQFCADIRESRALLRQKQRYQFIQLQKVKYLSKK